jgi:hypothetical protein
MVLMPRLMVYGKPGTGDVLGDYRMLTSDPEVPAPVEEEFRGFCRTFRWDPGLEADWPPVVAAKVTGPAGGLLFVRIVDKGRDSANRPHAMEFQGAYLDGPRERASSPEDLARLADPMAWEVSGQPCRLSWIGEPGAFAIGALAKIRGGVDWTFFGDGRSYRFRPRGSELGDQLEGPKDNPGGGGSGRPPGNGRGTQVAIALLLASGMLNGYLFWDGSEVKDKVAAIQKANKKLGDEKEALEGRVGELTGEKDSLHMEINGTSEKGQSSGYKEKLAKSQDEAKEMRRQMDGLLANADQGLRDANEKLARENKELVGVLQKIKALLAGFHPAGQEAPGRRDRTQPDKAAGASGDPPPTRKPPADKSFRP